MKIALLGAGNIGFASAAWLCHHGHQTVLWARETHTLAGIFTSHSWLHYTGVIEGECRPAVTTDIATAVRGADAVLLCVPGYGHRTVMETLAPHLTTGQPVIINSACSLSALFLSQLLAQHTDYHLGNHRVHRPAQRGKRRHPDDRSPLCACRHAPCRAECGGHRPV